MFAPREPAWRNKSRNSRTSRPALTHGINRLRGDFKTLMPRLKEIQLDIPDPDSPLSEREDDADDKAGDES